MSPRAINLAEKESEVLAYLLPLLLFLQQQQRRLSSGMARTSSRSSGQHQPQMAAASVSKYLLYVRAEYDAAYQ